MQCCELFKSHFVHRQRIQKNIWYSYGETLFRLLISGLSYLHYQFSNVSVFPLMPSCVTLFRELFSIYRLDDQFSSVSLFHVLSSCITLFQVLFSIDRSYTISFLVYLSCTICFLVICPALSVF